MNIEMGKKYQTRDGRAVRILCVDGPGNLCVYGIVTTEGRDFINPMRWEKDGRFSWSGYCPENDIMPVPTKHEGWGVKRSDPKEYGFSVFLTKGAAEKYLSEEDSRLPKSHIVPVTWED